jgi:radical SAM protein (TIGR01212 family)
LDWLNRAHHVDAFFDAVERSRQHGLRLGVHVILGLPGETAEDMIETARTLAELEIHSIKIHNLYVAKETRLAEEMASGNVVLPTREQYVQYVADFLEYLSPDCVIDRLSSDVPRQYLVAPEWCLEAPSVRLAIEAELERRDSWQGKKR